MARYLTPHLRISAVSKVRDVKGEGGWRYHVKIVNRSRHPVAEFSVDVVLVVPGLNPDIPDVQFRYRIPLAPGPVYPYLDAKECVIVGLRVNDLEGRLERLPDALRRRLATREVTLEELLSLQGDSSLRIAIRAAHYLSGNKRTYALRYTKADIRAGIFKGTIGGRNRPRWIPTARILPTVTLRPARGNRPG